MGRLHGVAPGGTTVIGGAAGFASATLIQQAGLTGGRALLAAGVANAVDFGVGAAADHYLLGDSWGIAVFGNALGFGDVKIAIIGRSDEGYAYNEETGEIGLPPVTAISPYTKTSNANCHPRQCRIKSPSMRQRGEVAKIWRFGHYFSRIQGR